MAINLLREREKKKINIRCHQDSKKCTTLCIKLNCRGKKKSLLEIEVMMLYHNGRPAIYRCHEPTK